MNSGDSKKGKAAASGKTAQTGKSPKQRAGKEISSQALLASFRSGDFKAPFDGEFSKDELVQAAVTMALRSPKFGRKWPPDNRKATMGGTYRFNKDSIRPFLIFVHDLLGGANPPYDFEFDNAFCLKAVSASVEQLMVQVYGNTTP